ncbi:MAG: four-carbon acid sugar kinase family protein [Cyclobacteriaceae bacterium]
MSGSSKIRFAFYGDDFTGSTDALEFLVAAGLKTRLFLDEAALSQADNLESLDAVGLAGMTRAMTPEGMTLTLTSAFEKLRKLKTDHVHYKVCSTFDSSPEIGNIGVAITCGQQVFGLQCTPILVAAPTLGRFMAFGNLFAKMGTGSNGSTYRLDQHPSMSQHPTTPAYDGDLRDHLRRQIDLKIGLIDLTDLEKSDEYLQNKMRDLEASGCGVVFMDAVYESQMKHLGSILDQITQKTLFSVGSSGVEKALGDYWEDVGLFEKRRDWQELTPVNALLVLSGSASPVTSNQIDHVVKIGWHEIAVDPQSLDHPDKFISQYADEIVQAIRNEQSVIIHTCKGPQDSRIQETVFILESRGLSGLELKRSTAEEFGAILGKTAKLVLDQVDFKRLVIAGGDTSSYVARQLGIDSVEMIAPLVKGAPLCKAFSKTSKISGMEVNLKGGQIGSESYFESLRLGKI